LTIAVMQKLRLKTHRAPAGTATWSDEAGPTLIIDETRIPRKFRHPPKPGKPDLTKIRQALEQHISVAGATIGNGGHSLSVRN
jgi:hypothetical protein